MIVWRALTSRIKEVISIHEIDINLAWTQFLKSDESQTCQTSYTYENLQREIDTPCWSTGDKTKMHFFA